jgi:hypothetical protein
VSEYQEETLMPDPSAELLGEKTMTTYGAVKLTNYRVLLEYGSSSEHRYVSVTLDAVSSCEVSTGSRPWLLALGILCGPAAVVAFLKNADLWICGGLLGIAVIMIVAYAATRNRGTLTIASHGQPSIAMEVDDVASAVTFLDRVQEMKLVALGRVRKPATKAETG